MIVNGISLFEAMSMDRIGRYPLSVILSFLTETEGCSLLICKKRWAKELLPVFRLPRERMLIQLVREREPVKRQKNCHRFMVIPVQDASVRLDRLNTRRWKQRKLWHNRHKTTAQVAQDEWRHPTAFPPLLQLSPSPHNPKHNSSIFRPGITLLVSYPRAGNTLIRNLLEGVTGIVTASDTRPDRALSLALAEQHDLVGEGLCQSPITKTHWPERIGCQRFRAQRAILVVRNPFDAIDSYWNLNLTNTHTEKVTDEVYDRFQDFFQELVTNEMRVWLDFTKYWVDSHSANDIPLLIVRYEDLIQNPRGELERILGFYTTVDWTDRLDTVLQHRSHGYQSSSRNSNPAFAFGRSLRRYTPALLERLHAMDDDQGSGGWLKRLGYHVYDQGFPNNMDSMPPVPVSTHQSRPKMNNPNIASSSPPPSMTINQPEIDLRPRNCPYGRNMRAWRRRHTKDDTEPFPTVPRK